MPYDPIERWEWEGGALASHPEPPDEAHAHDDAGSRTSRRRMPERFVQPPPGAEPSPIGSPARPCPAAATLPPDPTTR